MGCVGARSRSCRWVLVFGLVVASLGAVPVPAAADRSGDSPNDQIARLYLGVLGRSPDVAGEAYWNVALASGLSLREVADGFVYSQEFVARFGRGDDVVVRSLYGNVLGRSPDPGGFDYWIGLLDDGAEIVDVVLGFTESAEHRRRAEVVASPYDTDCPAAEAQLDAYLALLDQPVRVAAVDQRSGCVIARAADELVPVASTIKPAVMGAMMLRAQDDGRTLTTAEVSTLDGMIRFSDDAEVRPIIDSFGGSAAMLAAYGPRMGIDTFADATQWGCVSWSAATAVALVEFLVSPDSELDDDHRSIARDLMATVTPTQRWGVGDAAAVVAPEATAVMKNGFARSCASSGSRLHSMGAVLDANGTPQQIVAILTSGWVDGAPASRADDTPAYVDQGSAHLTAIATHLLRALGT